MQKRQNGGKSLIMTLTPNNIDLNGNSFMCRIITQNGKTFEETITLKVKGND